MGGCPGAHGRKGCGGEPEVEPCYYSLSLLGTGARAGRWCTGSLGPGGGGRSQDERGGRESRRASGADVEVTGHGEGANRTRRELEGSRDNCSWGCSLGERCGQRGSQGSPQSRGQAEGGEVSGGREDSWAAAGRQWAFRVEEDGSESGQSEPGPWVQQRLDAPSGAAVRGAEPWRVSLRREGESAGLDPCPPTPWGAWGRPAFLRSLRSASVSSALKQ